MKTQELKQQLLQLGLHYIEPDYKKLHKLNILAPNHKVVATLSLSEQFKFSTFEEYFNTLTYTTQQKLYKLLTKYAKTPTSERNELSIEEQTRQYIETSIKNNLSFKDSITLLEDFSLHYLGVTNCERIKKYTDLEVKTNHYIYFFYHERSNEFVKIWFDVVNSKGESL